MTQVDASRGQTTEAKQPGLIRIGRAEGNGIALPNDLRVALYHAELRRQADGSYELVDLGSPNGSFVNHERVKRRRLADGDVVSIGRHVFRFDAGVLAPEQDTLQPSFEAAGLAVELPGGRLILDEVDFHLEPSSLLAVVGPSGCGKTTLLNALTGFRPADSGTVFYGGRSLYEAYEDLRFRIGYVPQENILHDQLTVKQALRFAADLRFSPDVDRATRDQRIAQVIEEMDLAERADVRISNLSGGQRKRVNVALELLTQPSLLFLDEPTSGLDPGNEREMMELLRSLAADGRVVIVVTHSSQSLDLCDRVLFMAPGGKVAYFGPPKEALSYFEKGLPEGGYAAAFTALEEAEDVDWKERFRASPLYAQYIRRTASGTEQREREARQPLPPPPQLSFLRQLRILARRQLALILAEPRALLVLALQAPLLGLLYYTVFGPNSLSTKHGDNATLIVWLLAVGATWLGVANSITEVVKERAVYRRERSVGLSIGPYLGSKVLFYGVLAAAQACVLVAVGLARQPVPPGDRGGFARVLAPFKLVHGDFHKGSVFGSELFELMVAIALTGVAAVALGLFISTVVKSSNQALGILPLVLAVQVVLSLPLFQGAFATQLGKVTSARWGTDAAASTVSLNVLRIPFQLAFVQGRRDVQYDLDYLKYIQPPEPGEVPHTKTPPTYKPPRRVDIVRALHGKQRWDHRPGAWWTSVLAIGVLLIVPLAGAWFALRRRDLRVLAERPRVPHARRGLTGWRELPAVLKAAVARLTTRGAASTQLKPVSALFTPRHVLFVVVAGALVGTGIASAVVRGGHGRAVPFPTADERVLLTFVPRDVRASCFRPSSPDPKSARARVSCTAPTDANVSVAYYLFPTAATMEGWYGERVRVSGVPPGSGGCAETRFRGEDTFSIGGRVGVAGHVLCYAVGAPEVDWTNTAHLVGADAVDRSGDANAVLKQWGCCLGG
jgi:ABC transport system ATP-binding/permease protein